MRKVREITMVLLMIISLFSVLMIVNVPEVKAELNAPTWNSNGYWETPNAAWTIEAYDDISYENTKIVVNGDLKIENDGKLTLSNVTLQMNETTSDAGYLIRVYYGGEFNVTNGSIITTDPITPAQSPDPYEFRIDGTALIENSTVEKMKDRSGDADGIRVYSDNVEIIYSTIQLSEGHGVYIEDGEVLITNSNIINNNHSGVYIFRSSNNNIIGNNVSSNNRSGIYLWSSLNNNVIGNNVSSNIFMGIYLHFSNNNRIISNIFSSNSQPGIYLSHSSNNNITGNNISSNNHLGIYLFASSNNNDIIANIVTSNNRDGINVHHSSDYNKITGNNVSSNNDNGIQFYITSNNNIITNNYVSSNLLSGIYLWSSSNNKITGNNVSSNNNDGIYLYSSNNNKIGMNSVVANSDGINLTSTSNSNLITSNHLANNTYYGLYLASSDYNEIVDNTIQNSSYGIHLISANDNIVYHNNLNNTQNAYDTGTNLWDNGLEGNWWSDNPSPTDTDGNGICDSSYSDTSFTDYRPLANEDNDRVLVDDPWFWFIQSGVNFAEPGWTVYATSSTYLENVTINKTLTVSGEDRNSTIIDSMGTEKVVLVDGTSYVNISGFTVQNGTYGRRLYNSYYCVIKDNNVVNNTYGINLNQSGYIDVNDNDIEYNIGGIGFNSSDNCTISNNAITSNSKVGILIVETDNIGVENNTISGNMVGIRAEYSSSIIKNNNIFNNVHGISDVWYSSLTISDNIITNHSGNGISNMIYSNALICNNTIIYNNFSGISNIEYCNATIDNNTISHNGIGINCIDHSSPIITYNNITLNLIGISCESGSNATVHWNNIHNNTNYNLNNADPTINISAENNWWGSDPPDWSKIQGEVDADPWETEAIEEAGPQ